MDKNRSSKYSIWGGDKESSDSSRWITTHTTEPKAAETRDNKSTHGNEGNERRSRGAWRWGGEQETKGHREEGHAHAWRLTAIHRSHNEQRKRTADTEHTNTDDDPNEKGNGRRSRRRRSAYRCCPPRAVSSSPRPAIPFFNCCFWFVVRLAANEDRCRIRYGSSK